MAVILLTGADGFIGSHFLDHVLINSKHDVLCVCSWSHDGIPERISNSVHYRDNASRVSFVTHDLSAPFGPLLKNRLSQVRHVVNFAADSNVDRSIKYPADVIRNNVLITTNLLEWARDNDFLESFIQISTDEVYGAAYGDYCHKEWDATIPSNPYSASKACQEAIAISYWRTYGVPVVITNTMNNIGEKQHPDKFLPMIIRNIRDDKPIPIHAVDGVVGSRFYLHARNHADAVLNIIERHDEIPQYPAPGRRLPHADRPLRLNVVGDEEISNNELVQMVGGIMEKIPSDYLVDAHTSRPGHDLRYALDGTKIKEWGWTAPISFGESLERTVKWYLDNPEWLDIPTLL